MAGVGSDHDHDPEGAPAVKSHHLFLADDIHARLRAEAARRGQSLGDLIRALLEEALVQEQKAA